MDETAAAVRALVSTLRLGASFGGEGGVFEKMQAERP
jgi:hypothetical protein